MMKQAEAVVLSVTATLVAAAAEVRVVQDGDVVIHLPEKPKRLAPARRPPRPSDSRPLAGSETPSRARDTHAREFFWYNTQQETECDNGRRDEQLHS